jgi:hypothetical protein
VAADPDLVGSTWLTRVASACTFSLSVFFGSLTDWGISFRLDLGILEAFVLWLGAGLLSLLADLLFPGCPSVSGD